MTDIANAPAATSVISATERTPLEFEHKQALDLGKFFYDSFFKLASMNFVLNGLLLSALAFVLKDAGNTSKDLLPYAIALFGLIGIIYNLGAACACVSFTITAWGLIERFNEVDRLLHLQIASNKTRAANIWGGLSWFMTALFFVLWLSVWGLTIWYAVSQLQKAAV